MTLLKKLKSKILKSNFIGVKAPMLSLCNHGIANYQDKINHQKDVGFYIDRLNKIKAKKTKIIINAINKNYYSLLTDFYCLKMKSLEKIIFVFWYQGYDNMPTLIKTTYKSLLLNKGDYKVVLLDKNNISKYTSIPKFILQRLEDGSLSLTSFSDYLRIRLLCEYNCLWLDSTILVMQTIPKEYLDYPFISVKSKNIFDGMSEYSFVPNFAFGQAYFLGGKNKKAFNIIRSILEDYYKKYKYNVDYFMVYYIFEWLYQNDAIFKKNVDEMPYNNENVEKLLYYRNERSNFFAQKANDVIFKLSYKVDLYKALNDKDSLLYKYISKYF